MRLVTFSAGSLDPRYGLLSDDGIVDLSGRFPVYPTIASLLEARAANEIREAEDEPPDFILEDVRFLPPTVGAQKIICVGINYPERNQEYGDNRPIPRYPNLFVRFSTSLWVTRKRWFVLPPRWSLTMKVN